MKKKILTRVFAVLGAMFAVVSVAVVPTFADTLNESVSGYKNACWDVISDAYNLDMIDYFSEFTGDIHVSDSKLGQASNYVQFKFYSADESLEEYRAKGYFASETPCAQGLYMEIYDDIPREDNPEVREGRLHYKLTFDKCYLLIRRFLGNPDEALNLGFDTFGGANTYVCLASDTYSNLGTATKIYGAYFYDSVTQRYTYMGAGLSYYDEAVEEFRHVSFGALDYFCRMYGFRGYGYREFRGCFYAMNNIFYSVASVSYECYPKAENKQYTYGYDDGYFDGEDFGRTDGYWQGYNAGETYGYDKGYGAGQAYGESLHAEDWQYGYDIGYLKGTNDGVDLGYELSSDYYDDYWSNFYQSSNYVYAVEKSIKSNDSNPVTAFFNSMWNGLINAYDTVTQNVSVGGVSFAMVITSIVLAVVVIWVIKVIKP